MFLSTHLLPRERAVGRSRLFATERISDRWLIHLTSVTGQIHPNFACVIWISMLDKRTASDTRTPTNGLAMASASRKRTAMSHGFVMQMSPIIRVKKLSMPATARVIWLCACLRYWSGSEWVSFCHRFMFVICMVYGGTTFGMLTSMKISPYYP